jgi:hypothetical protein
MDAAALKSVAARKKPSLLEQIGGLGLLFVWSLFLIGEFFHLVEHQTSWRHELIVWSPLFVGLALLSRTAFHKITNLVVRLRGLRIN